MHKIFAAATAALIALTASAEGYQVNTFSARQEGMGHVGVALKLGSESQIFNPGALAFSHETFQISAGVSAIKATATATYDGQKYTTSNKVSTPLNVAASFRIYDNLYAGVTMYTPYGSSINWGGNWPGAVLNQSVDLKVYTVQPTISWRLAKNLSVGAGLMISWGSVNLNKALVAASSMDKLVGLMNMSAQMQGLGTPYETYGNVSPASVNLTGNSELALGVNVGVLWDVLPNLSLGASFRSKQNMHVTSGVAQVTYANEQARQVLGATLDNLNYANFDASMPCPYVLSFGVAYKPIKKLTLAFDAQLNGWGTYKQLDIAFADLPELYQQHLTKDYSNAMTYHIGAEYAVTNRLDVRAGMMIDCSPCNTEYYNPETPGMTKLEPSVGLSFRPIKGLSVDVAFMYVKGTGSTGTGQYKDFLAPTYNSIVAANGLSQMLPSLAETGEFTADYKTHALIPAIGVSYSF
jgi:long-chain fatty acid transport protein